MTDRYQDDRISFEPPADWSDQTIVSFASPLDAGRHRPNIAMTREARAAGSFDAHVDAQTLILATRLPSFVLRGASGCTVGGRAAVRVDFTWTPSGGRPVEQSVVHVEPEDDDDRVTTFTYTATWPAGFSGADAFDALLASVRFHPRAVTPRASTVVPRDAIVPMPGVRERR